MFNARVTANNWKTFYASLPTKDRATKHLTEIKAMTNSDLPTTDVFSRISKENDLLILALAQNKTELQVFHQPTILGGSFDDPTEHFVALLGAGTQAIPIEIDTASVKNLKINTPTWEALDGTNGDTESFKRLEVTEDLLTVDELNGKNMLAIPITLAEAFFNSPSKDPTSIALTFSTVMSEFDLKLAEHDDQELFSETFMHVIQFCWAAHRGLVPPISYCVSESPFTLQWSEFVHRNAIIARIPVQEANGNDTVQDDLKKTIESLKYELAYLKGNSDKNSSTSEKDDSKKGFKRLPKHVQTMILNASSNTDESAAPTPTETYLEFLEQKNAGDAKGYLQYQLESIKVSNFIPCQPLVSALHKGYFFWDRKDLPSNFSIFLCGKPTPISTTTSETITFAMKSENGNGLSDGEIAKTMKQVKQIPRDIHDALEQLQNFYSLCSIVFGDEAIISKAIKSMYQHVMNNKEHYSSRQAHDDLFLTKTLQRLDTATQLHLRSCLHSEERCDVDDDCLDFSQDFKEIMTNKFNVDVFDSLKPTTPWKQEESGRKRFREEASGGSDLFVQNKHQRKDWKAKPDEPYGAIFHKNQDKCPKDDNKLICMRFFIKGFCTENCRRLHKLSQEGEQAFDQFLKDCRGGAFKKNKKDQDFRQGAGKKD